MSLARLLAGVTMGSITALTFAYYGVSFDICRAPAGALQISVGWFNVAIGVAFLLLQVVMFQGEYKFSRATTINVKELVLSHVKAEVKCKELFWKLFVSQLNYRIYCISRVKDLYTICICVR